MSETRKAGGRPKAAPEAKRKQYDVRLTDAEWAAIEQAAQRAGLPARVWMRQVLLQTAQAGPPPPPGS
jgi:hypothetical protein